MKREELKKEMMRLWKETFRDSDDYVRLVFDNYFDTRYVEFEEKDGSLVASMMAVPYTFSINNHSISSVYLCGLATKKMYRKKGIMTSLLKKMEVKMRENNVDLMFLIPADDMLKVYYNERGFVDGFYRNRYRFTSEHDFLKEFENEISCEPEAEKTLKVQYVDSINLYKIESFADIQDEDLNKIVQYVSIKERGESGLNLVQSDRQIRVFIEELLLSGGKIYVASAANHDIAGIAFLAVGDSLEIRLEYMENEMAAAKIHDRILRDNPGLGLTIFHNGYDYDAPHSLWRPFSSNSSAMDFVFSEDRVYNPNHHSEMYGMVRILRVSEILKFMTDTRDDLKYSILVRQENDGKIYKYTAENGTLTVEPVDESMLQKEGMGNSVMKEQELAALLFRRPHMESVVMEAFGLPALDGKIFMMLD